MAMTKEEKFALQSMLDVCEKKFGELSIENIVISSACDSCSGSCKGHGISVWTACDVR